MADQPKPFTYEVTTKFILDLLGMGETSSPSTTPSKYSTATIINGDSWDKNIVFNNLPINLSPSVKNEYTKSLNNVSGYPKGIKLLAQIMTNMEGFFPGSKSYRTNNPGNIGNVDSGGTRSFPNLEAGIKGQLGFLTRVADNQEKNYLLNSQKNLPPYNQYPGYKFIYTGKLKQFIKIYSTGARNSNVYLSTIISYFHSQGYKNINENTTIKEIYNLK